MERGYAGTSLGQIHYRRAGTGHPLLLVHATTHSSRMFNHLAALLADEYQAIAIDLPGFGNSDPLPEDTSMPELAACLRDVLDDLGIESYHYFGHHTGNKIGAILGARHSDQIDRLVLCGQPHSIIPDEATRDEVIRAHVADSLRTFPSSGDGAQHLKAWGALQRRVSDVWWDPDVLSGTGCSEARIDILADRVLDTIQSRKSLETVYKANFAYDWTTDLQRIGVDSLILELADETEAESYGTQGSAVQSLIPDCELVTINAVDDNVFWESPEQIAAPVRSFLQG